MNDDRLQSLILDAYDCVADPARWPDMLEGFSELVESHGIIIFEWEGRGAERALRAPYVNRNHAPERITRYIERYSAYEAVDQDAFERQSLAADGIDLISDDEIMRSEQDYFAQPNVRALMRFDVRHRSGCLLDKDNVTRGRFSLQHGSSHGPIRPEERAVAGRLLPHVAKALELGRPAAELRAMKDSLTEAMNKLRIGVCILDANGRKAAANTEFERQAEVHRVFSFDPSARLRFTEKADQERFHALTEGVARHGQYGARPRKEAFGAIGPDSASALCIDIAPLTRADAAGEAAFNGFVLYSLDASRPISCDTRPMQQTFGLSDTEALLADFVAEGLTNVEIAERRSRSVATVNVQVKSLLAKTQCANRTQLSRLLMNFGAEFVAVA